MSRTPHTQRVLAVLSSSTDPAGVSSAELQAATGLTAKQTGDAIDGLRESGRAFPLGFGRAVRYYPSAESAKAGRPAYEAHVAARRAAALARRKEKHRLAARARYRRDHPGCEPRLPKKEAAPKKKVPKALRVQPAACQIVIPKSGRALPDKSRAAWLQAEPVITEQTKVTVCPSGTDSRYTFTPPPGWRGEFSQQWKQLRGKR